MRLPSHLQKYVTGQNFTKYTLEDHALWRLIVRKILAQQQAFGHRDCVPGLKKIIYDFQRIPKISDISKRLEDFGWRAAPVSGFLPPKAFMDFQAHGVLPIASEIRAADHILYTPAPDIVHEAIGHAPFLIHPAFSKFLKEYASTVKKALASLHDIKKYQAIRQLSDLKENPRSKAAEIKKAAALLRRLQAQKTAVSEAARLGRFIWWTAEYGLIGPLKRPRIYGAGLISSIGEAERSLSRAVKKIPLSEDCVRYSYDITSFQPQLFVARGFGQLTETLRKLQSQMAYKTGDLSEALKSGALNTVELDSGLQISGVLEKAFYEKGRPCFLKFSGPCQLAFKGREIKGQGKGRHSHGYSCPLGFSAREAQKLRAGRRVQLKMRGGIRLNGCLERLISQSGLPLIAVFKDCTVLKGGKALFLPDWGPFDMATGQQPVSVFGGAADEKALGREDGFEAAQKTARKPTKAETERFKIYLQISQLAKAGRSEGVKPAKALRLARAQGLRPKAEKGKGGKSLHKAKAALQKPEREAMRDKLRALRESIEGQDSIPYLALLELLPFAKGFPAERAALLKLLRKTIQAKPFLKEIVSPSGALKTARAAAACRRLSLRRGL